MDGEAALRILQSALSTYAAVYLLSAFGLPSFYLRYLSINELDARKASKWRIWLQAAVTILSVGVLVYAATYAIVAAIPYGWGSHDEDGEWSPLRDSVRGMLTFFGAIYLALCWDRVAKALICVKIERATRAALLRTISESYEVPVAAVQAAIDSVRRELKVDEFADRTWATEHQEEFTRAVVSELESAKRIKEARQW